MKKIFVLSIFSFSLTAFANSKAEKAVNEYYENLDKTARADATKNGKLTLNAKQTMTAVNAGISDGVEPGETRTSFLVCGNTRLEGMGSPAVWGCRLESVPPEYLKCKVKANKVNAAEGLQNTHKGGHEL